MAKILEIVSLAPAACYDGSVRWNSSIVKENTDPDCNADEPVTPDASNEYLGECGV
jgi:hypothetical protein